MMKDFFDTTLFTNGEPLTVGDIIFGGLIPLFFVLLISLVIFFIVRFFINSIYGNKLQLKKKQQSSENIKLLDGKIEMSTNKRKKYIRRLRKFFVGFIFFEVVVVIIRFVDNYTSTKVMEILSVFTKPFYISGKTNISIMSIFFIICLGYFAYIMSKFIRKSLSKALSNLPLDTRRRFLPLIQISGYVSLILIFVIGLSLIGIDISSLALVSGVLGIGIGFGLQDIVANFFSGLVIGFSRIITEGDRVFIQGIEGDVQRINLINTVVRSLTYEELIIPNKFILNEAIQNYSHTDSIVLASATVQVDYNSDLDHVEKVITRVGEGVEHRIKKRNIIFRCKSFDDSGITVGIFVWIKDVRYKYQVQSDLNMGIWRTFKREGIAIPFPQMDVYVKNLPNTDGVALQKRGQKDKASNDQFSYLQNIEKKTKK